VSAFSSSADLCAERVDAADVPAREFLSISILENALSGRGAVVTLRHDVTTGDYVSGNH
jgi:hypothetical protein